ncbi:MAG: insulinase family protein [Desulfobacterales bacterium]|nr:insulinase family protein [Desulfobacterales bacterium]
MGKSEIIQNISRDAINEYYNKWRYTPANMVTVIVGDVDAAKTIDLVKQKYNYNRSSSKQPVYNQEPYIQESVKKRG